MSEHEQIERLIHAVVEWRWVHPVIWQRTPEMRRVRQQLMRDVDEAEARGAGGHAMNESEQIVRLEKIVKGAWRFWAATQDSAVEAALDRGYTILRVRSDQYEAFDALFRAGGATGEEGTR